MWKRLVGWWRKGENRKVWVTIKVWQTQADILMRPNSLPHQCPSKVGSRPCPTSKPVHQQGSTSAQKEGHLFLICLTRGGAMWSFVYLEWVSFCGPRTPYVTWAAWPYSSILHVRPTNSCLLAFAGISLFRSILDYLTWPSLNVTLPSLVKNW